MFRLQSTSILPLDAQVQEMAVKQLLQRCCISQHWEIEEWGERIHKARQESLF
jgi:hypothetical protein